MPEPLRHVRLDGFTLQTWDTHRTDHLGKTVIRYEFQTPTGEVLFSGEDFACSPMDAIDSDECLRALLGFLVLRPGDTDREYFADYTPEQMEFAEGDAERLQIFTLEEEDCPEPFENLDGWMDEDEEEE